jgi:microcystin-dependent protein
MDAFVGTIMPVGFNYAPRGWLPCEGQLLPVTQYQLLFALIGNIYGGDGRTNFALPDLRGRAPVGTTQATDPKTAAMVLKPGQAVGSVTAQGSVTGAASLTMSAANMPAHTHQVAIPGSALAATSALHVTATQGQGTPGNNCVLGSGGTSGAGQATIYATGATAGIALSPASVTTTFTDVGVASQSTGAAQPTPIAAPINNAALALNVVQPSIGITYLIATTGLYPSRG